MCNDINNLPSFRSSPLWFCGNSHARNVMSGCLLTAYHMPKCMSCHKVIVVITKRYHCFHWYHGYIFFTDLVSLRSMHSVGLVPLLTTCMRVYVFIVFIYIHLCIYIHHFLSRTRFLCLSNVSLKAGWETYLNSNTWIQCRTLTT